MIPQRIRKGVISVSFPAEQAAIAQQQIAPIIAYHVAGFTAFKDIDEQMKRLAFDAYVQGLLDGAHVSGKGAQE